MARTARFLKDGVCYYIQTHSFIGQEIFKAQADYYRIMQILKRYKMRYSVHIYAFCLMPADVYLIIHPSNSRHLPLFMQGVNQTYALYFNRRYKNEGKVWRQRYKSAVIQNDVDLFDAITLVEFIPVQRNQSRSPIEYPWSSSACRVLGSGSIVDTIPPGSKVISSQT
jgi:REP element-mobilizing transposase RayT